MFSLGSGAIAWSSKKQNVIAFLSTKADYITATSASQAVWLRRLIVDFGQAPSKATNVFCYNKSTISIAKILIMHGCAKHVEICLHFSRDLITKGEVHLDYCSTNEQAADILTKALPI